MDIFFGIFIAFAYIVAVVVTRQITTLLHEMGHAIPAVLFNKTPQPVQVFIGSYGDISNTIRLNFNRLQLFIKPRILDWKLGMCKSPPTGSIPKDIIITLGGPLASTLIAGVFLYVIIYTGGSDLWITFAAICM
ncbi:MAG: M50 family metallopeptidase, partial [Bacteroidota bacterium]